MSIIKKFFDGLYKLQVAFATFSLSILCAMIILQIFLRYVLHAPLFGIEELETYPIIWIYLFGGTMASYERTHIQCGIVGVISKNEKIIYIFNLIRDVINFIISAIICYWVYDYFAYCLKVWKMSGILHLPLIFAEGAIFIGLVIMSLLALRDILETINKRQTIFGKEV